MAYVQADLDAVNRAIAAAILARRARMADGREHESQEIAALRAHRQEVLLDVRQGGAARIRRIVPEIDRGLR